MARIMLINGRYAEELRVAIVEDGRLSAFEVQAAEGGLERGNIYRGTVKNVESSLDAAFIDYGGEKHGFLTRNDVVAQAYAKQPDSERPAIDDVLQKGCSVLVQVTKDAAGTKGAALTTNLSLPGRYLVWMPFDSTRGMSRKVEDEAVRKKLKEKVKNLPLPEGSGLIVRTNAVDQTKTTLRGELAALRRIWKRLLEESEEGQGPRLLYNDQDLVVHALRDQLDSSITELVIDDQHLFEQAEQYLDAVMPRRKLTLALYDERVPLFSRYNLEPQVNAIYRRKVDLPSGGSLVIDPTEALTAIDINSGKSTGGSTQGETARQTNMEAAAEIARQLQLRDIGGLLVVDFIDMRSRKHRAAVEKALREAMKPDRARHRIGRISSNGLLEINRQRIGQALRLRSQQPCPSCDGVGRLLAPQLRGLGLLRRIEARAATGRLQRARVALHPRMADELQNRRRHELAALERELRIQIEIVGRSDIDLGDERIEWINRESPIDSWPDKRTAQQAQRGDTPKTGGRKRSGRRRRRSRRGGDNGEPAEQDAKSARSPASKGRARKAAADSQAPDSDEKQVDVDKRARDKRDDAPQESQRDQKQEATGGQEGRSGGRRRRRGGRRRRRQGGGGATGGQPATDQPSAEAATGEE